MKRGLIAFCLGAMLWLGGASLARSENYCRHPLLPVVVGAQWFYSGEWNAEEEGFALTVQSVFTRGSVTNAILNLALDVLGGAPLPVPLYCTSAEGIRLVELNSFAVPLPGGAMLSLQFRETSGVILPPMNQITSGASWPFVLDFQGTLKSEKGKIFNIALRMEIMSRFAGLTDVVVPAGSFSNVYKINQDVLLTLSFGERFSVPKKFKANRVWYLAENVGMVAADFEEARTELIRVSVPVGTQ